MMTVPQAFELAVHHHQAGRLAEAEALYRQILAAHPDHPDALHLLGVIAHQIGRHDLAVEWIRRSILFNPNFAQAHYNLGNAFLEQGLLDEAAASYRRAIALEADFAYAHHNLGVVFKEQGLLDGAIAACRRALALNPRHFEAKLECAMLLLLRGDFDEGFPLYETRWDVAPAARRHFPQPMWEGGPVEGRRVLVHAEQGFGDTIQFIRYAPLMVARGGEVIIECQRPLVDLIRGATGVSEVVAAGDPLPPFDIHVPMLSQPLAFKTTIETIPAHVPYLFVEPDRRQIWEALLGAERKRLRVGLAWAGNHLNRRSRTRDVSLEMLLPLLRVEGIDFFSLQVGDGAGQLLQVPGAAAIQDHTHRLHDFADTAALMASLDLIISVETAVAHLAGALGRPAWTLVPFAPDWRWGFAGEDTPWYPKMRLFRQPAVGDWASVIRRVVKELEQAAKIRARTT